MLGGSHRPNSSSQRASALYWPPLAPALMCSNPNIGTQMHIITIKNFFVFKEETWESTELTMQINITLKLGSMEIILLLVVRIWVELFASINNPSK